MAKKTVQVETRFAVFFPGDECDGVYDSLDDATEGAKEVVEDSEVSEVMTIFKLVPVRIVRQNEIVVEDL